MTKVEAHELLNAARAGYALSGQEIAAALIVTGDLAPVRRAYSQAPAPEAWALRVVEDKRRQRHEHEKAQWMPA